MNLNYTASFPMYDWPELRQAHQELWEEIRAMCGAIKTKSDLQMNVDLQSPNLLMSQTCGLPLMTTLAGAVEAFAAPDYGVHGGGVGKYSSAIIVRKADAAKSLKDTQAYRLAYNGLGSQSGYSALRYHLQSGGYGEGHFSEQLISGGHRNTVKMVAAGDADIGAIDSLCWDLAQQFEPEAVANLRVLDWTVKTPAMPYIFNQYSPLSGSELYEVLSKAIEGLTAETRKQLRLNGLKKCNAGYYQPIKQQFDACRDFQMVPH